MNSPAVEAAESAKIANVAYLAAWDKSLRLNRKNIVWSAAKERGMNKFATDAARYKASGERGKDLWLNPALWTIAFYRLRNWVNVSHPAWPIRFPVILLCFFANKFCEVFMEMSISPRATIGEGLYIGHIGGVHISPYAIIGRNCDIAHRVTIGTSGMGRQGAPIIGDNVYIGTGATLVGRLKIGDGARIAANTLVIDDIPAGATVMGVPGRIILGPSSKARPVFAAAEATER